jgi:23S rRNA (uracil1939-C5)-methyltransferase
VARHADSDLLGHAQGRRGGDRDSGRAPAPARPVTLAGSATVTDAARDLFAGDSPVSELAAWTRHAAAFFKGNRHCTGALVRRVLDFTTTDRVVDLYAGVGLFAVALAARGASVVAIEGDRLAAADLSANAGPWRARLATICAPVEQAAAVLHARRPESGESDGTPGTVIVDPPRTGLSPAALAQVLALGAKEVIYVSCDAATLARDAAHLVADGFRLDTIDAFDLFPNTPHIETVVRFLRA